MTVAVKPTKRKTRSSARSETPPARRTKGFEVIRWIEHHCRFTNGEWIGQPFRLLPWQVEIIKNLFEVRPDGLRRYRWAYVSVPKKNGKTELAAALALYLLIGDGEPSPLVVCAAASDEQADLVFGAARKMCELSPTLSLVTELYDREILVPSIQGAKLIRVAAVAGTNDGKNISAVICDELHEWVSTKGENVWNVLTNGTGARRQPMVMQITTAGFDRETVCFRQYEKAKGVLNGSSNDKRYYAYISEPPLESDYRDPETWRRANPSYGTTVHQEFFEDQLAQKPEAVFRRYFLNEWTSTATAWLPHGAWEGIVAVRDFDPDVPFVAFLDGSWSNDSTGIVSATLDEPHLSVRGHWLPDADLGHIDMVAVEDRCREILEAPGCRGLAFDPRGFQDLFARFEAEGYPVVEWPTNSLARMVPACQDFFRAVVEKRVSHDGDPRLAEHVRNAVVKDDRYGPRIVKQSKTSMRKIDLAVCAVGAYSEALRHASQPPAFRSNYESHGLTFANS